MSLLDMSRVTTLVTWSDAGPHFKSYRFLASVGIGAIERFTAIDDVFLNYGCEHHFKSRCDGIFGTTSWWRQQAACDRTLSEIGEVVEVINSASESACKLDGELASILAVEWMPPPRSSVLSHKLVAARSPHGIAHCFSWRFHRNDRRRVSVWGRPPDNCAATAIDCRGLVVADLKGPHEQKFLPEVEREAMTPDVDDDLAGGVLDVYTKEWNGWRVSYRQSQPEKEDEHGQSFGERIQQARAATVLNRMQNPEESR